MTLPSRLLIAHFVGDFLLQSDWMAINKSKRWFPLFAHVYVYSFVVALFTSSLLFCLVTFVTHFITDAITSRITSKLWFIRFGGEPYATTLSTDFYDSVAVYKHRRHWFFVALGADQLIHFITLAVTYRLLA